MTPIGIFCHWHTGSTILARIFAAAGMEVGNEETGFVGRKPGQEHPAISIATNNACLEHLGRENVFNKTKHQELLKKTLESYVDQANKNDWKFFGIKNNYMLDSLCWSVFGDIFRSEWPSMEIVCSLRHPIDIWKTTADSTWTEEQIVEAWLHTVKITEKLVKCGAKLILFPFNKNTLRDLLKSMGLKYNKKIIDMYDRGTIKNISTASQIKAFESKYPEVKKAYNNLKKLAIG